MVRSSKRSRKTDGVRRRSLRFRLEIPATLWSPQETRGHGLQTRTKNISKQGLCFHGESASPLGEPINFELQFPAGSVLRGQGRLVRFEDLGDQRIGFASTMDWYEFLHAAQKDLPTGTQTVKPTARSKRNL